MSHQKKPAIQDLQKAIEEAKEKSRAEAERYLARYLGKADFDSSTLPSWFELDRWDDKEALCLILDIDPVGADISWSGFNNFAGVRINTPRIKNASFLSEDEFFYVIPRSHELEKDNVDEDVRYKEFLICNAEGQLERLHKILNRNTKVLERPLTPIEWVKWCKKYQHEPRWLGWAIDKGLIDPEALDDLNDEEPEKADEFVGTNEPDKLPKKASNTYLTLIAALLDKANINWQDDHGDSKRGISKMIAGITQDYGAPITDRTIRDILKEIPDALAVTKKYDENK